MMVHISNFETKSYDIIVVGAGVIGAALTYELAQHGVRVALIEKNQPASGASGAAGGMLAAHSEHFAHKELHQLALYSQSLYQKLATDLLKQTGIDIGLRTEGFLLPLTEEELQLTDRNQLQTYQPSNYTVDTDQFLLADKSNNPPVPINADSTIDGKQWWSPSYLAQMEPHIHAPLGMIYNPNEPQLIPAQASIQQGVDFYPDTEVYRLLHTQSKDHITGVLTNRGEIFAEQVVLTTGLHTQQLLATEQYRLTFLPIKGELIEVRTPSPYLRHTIYGKGIYIIPKNNNTIWIGATSKPERTDTTVDVSAIPQLLSEAEQFLPTIGTATFERCWSGVRPGTPDELPYLGKVQPFAGLWTASGHYRNGILLAAGTAKWMAEALINNHTAHIPDCFSPARALYPLKSLSTVEGVSIWN